MPFNDLAAMEAAISVGDAACVIMETIPATYGFPMPGEGYLAAIKALCDKYGSLYVADEVFFTGSAAEITPIASIDRIPIGGGGRGPITKKLQDSFFAILSGDVPDRHGWLTPVGARQPSAGG